MNRIIAICLVCTGMFLSSLVQAAGISINPADAKGIRKFYGDYYLLSFLAINLSNPDRTVIEFDLSSIKGSTPVSATLDLGIANWDPGLPYGVIDFYTFKGDGIVTTNDYDAGGPNPYMSVVVGDVWGLVKFDVTSAVQNSLTAGDQFLGFRLSTTTTDRYFMGSTVGLPYPVLTVVPELPTILSMEVTPRTINLKSNGQSIKTTVWLDDTLAAEDVNVSSLLLLDTVPASKVTIDVVDNLLMIEFDHQDVQSLLTIGDTVEITLDGQMQDGTFITATDTVKVINPGK